MIDYSKAAIVYSVLRCVEKQEFKVLIATPHRIETLQEIEDIIQSEYKLTDTVRSVSARENKVNFINGSSITIVPASESLRLSNKYHLCVVDENLDVTALRSVYYPMELLYLREKEMKKMPR